MGLALIRVIDEDQAGSLAVQQLGLDPDSTGIDSPEALAAAVRRAASFLCPTTERELVNGVVASLEWIVPDPTGLRSAAESTVQAVVNYGDLTELPNPDVPTRRSTLLFLASPAFIPRRSGGLLLVGVPPEGRPMVDPDIQMRVEVERHVRMIAGPVEPELLDSMRDSGLFQLSADVWLQSPRPVSPETAIMQFDERLDATVDVGEVSGLRILDPDRPPHYYAGRWRVPTAKDRGRFVARRPREYGADAWCYVELHGGQPRRLVDLPITEGLVRGCDEAWRLQAAIDALRGRPLVVRAEDASGDAATVRLNFPPPSWLQRRWDALGTPLIVPNALIAYRLPRLELSEELAFVQAMLWAGVVT
jgi:hypothetical protein